MKIYENSRENSIKSKKFQGKNAENLNKMGRISAEGYTGEFEA
jgi:hypothetical protein